MSRGRKFDKRSKSKHNKHDKRHKHGHGHGHHRRKTFTAFHIFNKSLTFILLSSIFCLSEAKVNIKRLRSDNKLFYGNCDLIKQRGYLPNDCYTKTDKCLLQKIKHTKLNLKTTPEACQELDTLFFFWIPPRLTHCTRLRFAQTILECEKNAKQIIRNCYATDDMYSEECKTMKNFFPVLIKTEPVRGPCESSARVIDNMPLCIKKVKEYKLLMAECKKERTKNGLLQTVLDSNKPKPESCLAADRKMMEIGISNDIRLKKDRKIWEPKPPCSAIDKKKEKGRYQECLRVRKTLAMAEDECERGKGYSCEEAADITMRFMPVLAHQVPGGQGQSQGQEDNKDIFVNDHKKKKERNPEITEEIQQLAIEVDNTVQVMTTRPPKTTTTKMPRPSKAPKQTHSKPSKDVCNEAKSEHIEQCSYIKVNLEEAKTKCKSGDKSACSEAKKLKREIRTLILGTASKSSNVTTEEKTNRNKTSKTNKKADRAERKRQKQAQRGKKKKGVA